MNFTEDSSTILYLILQEFVGLFIFLLNVMLFIYSVTLAKDDTSNGKQQQGFLKCPLFGNKFCCFLTKCTLYKTNLLINYPQFYACSSTDCPNQYIKRHSVYSSLYKEERILSKKPGCYHKTTRYYGKPIQSKIRRFLYSLCMVVLLKKVIKWVYCISYCRKKKEQK